MSNIIDTIPDFQGELREAGTLDLKIRTNSIHPVDPFR